MTTLTMQDEKRLDAIQRVYRSELTVVQAALAMGISERQCYRTKARVRKVGAKGVVHGNRGRPCKRPRRRRLDGWWSWPEESTKASTITI